MWYTFFYLQFNLYILYGLKDYWTSSFSTLHYLLISEYFRQKMDGFEGYQILEKSGNRAASLIFQNFSVKKISSWMCWREECSAIFMFLWTEFNKKASRLILEQKWVGSSFKFNVLKFSPVKRSNSRKNNLKDFEGENTRALCPQCWVFDGEIKLDFSLQTWCVSVKLGACAQMAATVLQGTEVLCDMEAPLVPPVLPKVIKQVHT